MEHAQARAVRKRRRWLIATFFLALAVIASWWYWPRGDARFVGKWIVGFEHAPDIHGGMTLTSDGKGIWPVPGGGPGEHFPWSVRGNVFTYGYRARSRLWWTIHELSASLTGGVRDVHSINDFQIISVGPDEIRLRPSRIKSDGVGRPATMILTRIRE